MCEYYNILKESGFDDIPDCLYANLFEHRATNALHNLATLHCYHLCPLAQGKLSVVRMTKQVRAILLPHCLVDFVG